MNFSKHIPTITIIILCGIIIGQNLAFMTNGYKFIRKGELAYKYAKYYEGTPYPRISQDMVVVNNFEACIKGDYEWASFTDTGSMYPTFDYGHFVIHKAVDENTEIFIGDIIAYELNENTTIVHRVIDIDYDNQGKYYITQGDNLEEPDPVRITHDMIKRVVVAIIY